MKIPRISVVTLGVADLRKATKFYEAVLGTPPNTSYGGIDYLGRDTSGKIVVREQAFVLLQRNSKCIKKIA